MKLTISRDLLLAGLGAVMPAVPSRPVNVVLACVLIRAENGALYLDATDGDVYIQRRLAADIDRPGSALVPAAALESYVKGLTGAHVTLDLVQTALTVTSGRSTATINTSKFIDSFPAHNAPEESTPLDVEPLKDALQNACGFVDNDAKRYTGCICLRASSTAGLVVIGTDMTVLYARKLGEFAGEFTAVIPAAAAKAAIKALPQDGLSFAHKPNGPLYFIHAAGFCRVPTAEIAYPPEAQINQIIGLDVHGTARIGADELRSVVQRQLSFSERDYAPCVLEAKDGVLRAEGKQFENGYAVDEAECELDESFYFRVSMHDLLRALSPFGKGAELLIAHTAPPTSHNKAAIARLTSSRWPDVVVIISGLTQG